MPHADSSVPLDPEFPPAIQSIPVRSIIQQILLMDPRSEAGGLLLIAAVALDHAMVDDSYWTDAQIARSGIALARSGLSDVMCIWLASFLHEPLDFLSQRDEEEPSTATPILP